MIEKQLNDSVFIHNILEYGVYWKSYTLVCPDINQKLSGFERKELRGNLAIFVEAWTPINSPSIAKTLDWSDYDFEISKDLGTSISSEWSAIFKFING